MEAEEDGQRGKERKHGARSSAEVREALLPKRCSKADTMSLRPFRLKLGGAIMQTASNQDTECETMLFGSYEMRVNQQAKRGGVDDKKVK